MISKKKKTPDLLASCLMLSVLLTLSLPRIALAQRELHWDRLDVEAGLDAAGSLRVTETHAMVFTGDWNGGERKFNIRRQQQLTFTRISRLSAAGPRDLHKDRSLLNIDDYAWTDARTLRWRSRLPTDPPFAGTAITYVLEYQLSGILVKRGDRYVLNHDFAFPDRNGTIDSFVLRLTLDPAWQPLSEVQKVYMASGLASGQRFVLTVPMRYAGTGQPAAREGPSPASIAMALLILLGATALAMLGFFWREESWGRFVPVTTDQIDDRWIAEHILRYPAEVVAATWDDSIGTPEVVALIARLVREGKLESEVAGNATGKPSITLRLKVDRSTFDGHERALVDALFFDGRTESSTEDVRSHYRDQGFNPVEVIRSELDARVQLLLEPGDSDGPIGLTSILWFLACAAMLAGAWYLGGTEGAAPLFLAIGALAVAGIARIAGVVFRTRMDWGRLAALLSFLPAMTFAAATAAFLWRSVARSDIDLSLLMMTACVALSLWVTNSSIRGMRSRPSRAAVALRKKLTAAREFFSAELQRPQPALRDDWYPWVLAFGLGEQADAWSTERAATTTSTDQTFQSERPSSDSSAPARPEWTGFGGGRSGGAGGAAAWSAAAAGMAESVPSPASSGSDGSSGSSSGGGDSGGGSSGGGGGGGW